MSPPLFCSMSHLYLLPLPFYFWVILATHHGLLPHHPSHLLLQVPQGLAFPIHSPANNATLHLEIQLMRGVLLHWEEPWPWRGVWHTPGAPQCCSRREPLAPHKAPSAGCMSHMPLSVTDSHGKGSAAPRAAGGEVQEALGHCCEAVRSLSVLLLGQWHQAKGEAVLFVLCKEEWCTYEHSDAFQIQPPLSGLLECGWSWTSLCADVWECFALTLHWCQWLHEVWGSGESGSQGLLTRWQIINDSVQYKCNSRNSEIKAFSCQVFVCHLSNKLPA